jgi:hypothetical protein
LKPSRSTALSSRGPASTPSPSCRAWESSRSARAAGVLGQRSRR